MKIQEASNETVEARARFQQHALVLGISEKQIEALNFALCRLEMAYFTLGWDSAVAVSAKAKGEHNENE